MILNQFESLILASLSIKKVRCNGAHFLKLPSNEAFPIVFSFQSDFLLLSLVSASFLHPK